ncbi:MAG: epoxyqueuosine reductase QueH [Eggerthellaceae bacterium]|nr:epoxyqueuosine reductase QueH [Eggerthellaceae bacterium]
MKKLLLHVCCAPCAIEPLKVLLKEGYELTLYFSNSNMINHGEFHRRLNTLLAYTGKIGVQVVVDDYDPNVWEHAIEGHMDERCRYCYRHRISRAAQFAKAEGFEFLASSLAVSVYQKFDVLAEEIQKAAIDHVLIAVNHDYRSLYKEGQQESMDLGMYRQKFCGCKYSFLESFDFRFKRSIVKTLKKKLKELKRNVS